MSIRSWILPVLGIGLLIGLLLASPGVLAAPSGQMTSTPESTPPGTAPSSDDSELEGLLAAVDAENRKWQNITFWSDGTLGDSSLADLALNVAVGELLPEIAIPLYAGGEFRPAEQARPLLLNFWASWCGPCQQEVPYLLDMHADPDAPFQITVVNVLDDKAAGASFAQAEFPSTLTSGQGSDTLVSQLGIRAIPTSILVDARQEIVAIHLGNITPTVVDLLYWLAGHGEQEAAPAEANPVAEPSPELLEEVARANQAGGALSLWAGGRLGVESAPLPALNVGDKLPGFGFVTNQGQNYQLDLAERPQLINFWASWCTPCRDEFPLLIAAQARPDGAFDVVFVNVWDDPVTYQDYLADYPDDLVAMIDVHGDLPEQYGFEMVPVTLLVDGEGRIRLIHVGPLNPAVLSLADVLAS